jgi:hypothetical protein
VTDGGVWAPGRGRICRAALASAFCVLALAACGDDEDGGETEQARTATAPAQTATGSPTSTAPTVETTPPERAPSETGRDPVESPEDQPGGAGDEEPARSQALFTGRSGQIRPRIVLVPPFLAVRVELRSQDGRAYSLAAGGRTLRADSEVTSASTTFDGLRPGRRIVLRGTAGRVIIEASAEPGP